MASKKSQAMVVELIVLILICSIFFLFMSNNVGQQAITAGTMRSQSTYTQKLLISTLNYKMIEGVYEGATIAELIGTDLCSGTNHQSNITSSVHEAMDFLNKPGHYFIFTYGDSINKAVYNNLSCVKTEKITVASTDMEFYCGNATVTLGIWPASMEVESCE